MKKSVLVVGAGLAGLCAAVSAAERGAHVLVLEAAAHPGGMTLRSDGLMGGVDPRRLRPYGLEDNAEQYAQVTLAAGGRRGQRALVETLAYESTGTITWLETIGVVFDDELHMSDRSFFPRLHLPKCGTPEGYVEPLYAEARRLGVRFVFHAPVARLSRTTNGWTAAAKDGRTWEAERLIVATGGFAGDRQKVLLEDPRLAKTRIVPEPSKLTTGLRMLEAVGAQSLHLSYTQKGVRPADGGPLAPFFRNPSDIIAVNDEGVRFLQEDIRIINFAEELLNRTNGCFCFIGTPNWMTAASPELVAEPVEMLAVKLNLPAAVLRRTIAQFNAALLAGQSDPLGRRRETMPDVLDPERLLGVRMVVETLTTLGGILITPDGEVQDKRGAVMNGLFAAGDAAGGIHGRNAVTGNTLLAAALFGRRAGLRAAGD